MKKGFTLIELLIASSIFIIVMVMAASVFASAAGYNTKLHEMRQVDQVNREATEQLSKEIRLANGNIKAKYRDAAGAVITEEVGEIALFKCGGTDGSSCRLIKNLSGSEQIPTVLNDEVNPTIVRPSAPTVLNMDYNFYGFPLHFVDTANETQVANSLLIAQKDQDKLIFYRNLPTANNFIFHRLEISYPTATLDVRNLDVDNTWTVVNPSSPNNGVSLKVAFAGYTASKMDRKQQPFVEMLLRTQSWNYNDISEKYRASFDLKTSVETRDYNPS